MVHKGDNGKSALDQRFIFGTLSLASSPEVPNKEEKGIAGF